MDTPENSERQEHPEGSSQPGAGDGPTDAATPTRRLRRSAKYAALSGVTALALIGAATVGAVTVGKAQAGSMAAGDGQERVTLLPANAETGPMGGWMRGRRGVGVDDERRAERMAEVAAELDLDPDAVAAAFETLHAERAEEREARLEERRAEREAMRDVMREENQARVRETLVDLGADADAVDELLERHAAR